MEPKTVQETQVCISRMLLPEDANAAGIVHGGVVMKEIDNAAGVVAVRHARKIAVTASINSIDFHSKIFIGNLLTIKASLNCVGRTSMEIGARVEAEDLITGEVRHVASAYLTFVALGPDNKSSEVPPLVVENEEEERRHSEANARKKMRQTLKELEKTFQEKARLCKELETLNR